MKRFLCTILLGLVSMTAYAEQPAAEQYREMFKSGNFFVEYKDSYSTRVLGGRDTARMERTKYSVGGFSLFSKADTRPDTLYEHGKYYQFTDKNKAIVQSWDRLQDENLNPRQGWNSIQQRLALPDELAVFCWWDPYRKNSAAFTAPSYRESTQVTIKNKVYDCDVYSTNAVSKGGTVKGRIDYCMYYDAGKLTRIVTKAYKDDVEYKVNDLQIKRLSADIPEGEFKIPTDTKVYAAGVGDMDDLLDNPVQVDVLNGGKGDE